jgi:hypothetical protein
MLVFKEYTDDGYVRLNKDEVDLDISLIDLIEILYDKKILSASDVNKIVTNDAEVDEAFNS